MARQGDAERGGQVQVLVAVDVTDVAPLRLLPKDGEAITEKGDVTRLYLAQTPAEFAGARARRRNDNSRQTRTEGMPSVQDCYPSFFDSTAVSGARYGSATMPIAW